MRAKLRRQTVWATQRSALIAIAAAAVIFGAGCGTSSFAHPNASTAVSAKNCAYLKNPSALKLIAIDAAMIALRRDGALVRSIHRAANQSKPVVAMISRTKNGFHAA